MDKTESNNNPTSKKDNNCIWMEAGMVAYKLCDLDFNCDACPLDDLLRKKSAAADEPPLSSLYASIPERGSENTETPTQQFERQLEEFFQPLFSVQLPDDRLYHRCQECRSLRRGRRDRH